MTETKPTEQAEETFKSGPVFASIWQRQGTKGSFLVAHIRRRYRDKQEQWQSSNHYSERQLENVIEVANQALAYIRQHDTAEQPEPARAEAKPTS